MRCRVALQTVEYTATFEQPLFTLVNRQTELAQACFNRFAPDFPLSLPHVQATGGTTFADVVVAVRLPALRGMVEVRVDRLAGRFEGLATQDEADRALLAIGRGEEALRSVFPDVLAASTSLNVMSWLTCDDDKRAVEENLAARQHVQFEAAALGANKARFAVRGEIANEDEGWTFGFGLEPSAPAEFDLYLVCLATYTAASRYRTIAAQRGHLSAVFAGILEQFGFRPTL
ncbi:MAG: hypothetical protein ACXW3P_02870 [Rhodospirillales bacterium]